MENKRWILALVIVVATIAALSIWGFKKSNNTAGTNNPEIAGQSTETPAYFAEDAQVMYFYSDYCSLCIKEKEILQKLGTEGYKVKPMNVGVNVQYWTDYKISGTPTFVAKNGDRLEGYQVYDKLKTWLDSHK